MLKYVCKICGQTFNHHIPFNAHLSEHHGLSSKNYYDKHIKSENEGKCVICSKPTAFISATKGYRECCSVGCANTQRTRKVEESGEGTDVTCAICNETLHSNGTTAHAYTKLFYHINTVHGITSQKDYYDDFIKKDENEGICPICGKETEFKSIALGYNTFCSAECSVENAKLTSTSAINTYKEIKEKKSIFKELVNSIKEKYKKFISGGDNLLNYSDVRDNPIERKNVSNEKTFIDPENKKEVTVKTEISCNPTFDWIGSQTYKPKSESCNSKYKNWYNDDIDDDQGFSSNEWC